MKSTKLTITLCAILLSSGLLHAQKVKPTDKNDFTVNLAEKMLKSISRDIVLTDSQKVALQTNAKEYEVKIKELKGQSNAETKKQKTRMQCWIIELDLTKYSPKSSWIPFKRNVYNVRLTM